jgi:hypothetical protein
MPILRTFSTLMYGLYAWSDAPFLLLPNKKPVIQTIEHLVSAYPWICLGREALAAVFAFVALTTRALVIPAAPDDVLVRAVRALHAGRPSQLSDCFIATRVIDQILDA